MKAREILINEAKSWEIIQNLRKDVEANFDSLLIEKGEEADVTSKKEAIEKGVVIAQEIYQAFMEIGITFLQADPGHGVGHLVRDWINGLMLLSKLEVGLKITPQSLLIGFLGGVTHDIGCTLVPRYRESETVIRHGEAGAIIMSEAFKMDSFGLSKAEHQLIAYSVAAHTHYPKAQKVKCSDGILREIIPYKETYPPELAPYAPPIIWLWIPRWIDRLDCSGPCFPGRHFLTLAQVHKDFNGEKFVVVELEGHMLPFFKERAGCHTMVHHINMFANSQSRDTIYGWHDVGGMIELRDEYKAISYKIVEVVRRGEIFAPDNENRILEAWKLFLAKNIEPTLLGKKAAIQLDKMFRELPEKSRHSWCNGFLCIMKEYIEWAEKRINFLNTLNPFWLKIPGITDDVRDVISPSESWTKLIN